MLNGKHEVEVLLPCQLHRRLVATAKAENTDVSTLIVNAIKADLRSSRYPLPRQKPLRKT